MVSFKHNRKNCFWRLVQWSAACNDCLADVFTNFFLRVLGILQTDSVLSSCSSQLSNYKRGPSLIHTRSGRRDEVILVPSDGESEDLSPNQRRSQREEAERSRPVSSLYPSLQRRRGRAKEWTQCWKNSPLYLSTYPRVRMTIKTITNTIPCHVYTIPLSV